MIAFQTLFLGLVFGFAPVRVMVSPPVASVEILVDGAPAGTITGEPWELGCNFGPAPLPHELVAIGRDASGKEVARARQWVNLPRQGAEARVLVEGPKDGKPAVARVSWNTIDNAAPKRFEVFLDGAPVNVKDPARIELPAVDLSQPHFLVAEVVFPKGVVARSETSFGGDFEASAASELSAIAVVVRPGFALPGIEAMQGWFLENGEPLRVVAVEEGYLDVAVVFDQDAFGRFRGISRGSRRTMDLTGGGRYNNFGTPAAGGDLIPIQASKGGNRLFALWSVPKAVPGPDKREVRGLFPMSITLDLDVDELRTLIFRFPAPTARPFEQSLANAVATGGMYAAALNHRRAVVLVVGEAPPDASTISVAAARAYLESLNVPLVVWTPERRISEIDLPGWGLPDDVSTDLQLQGAMSRLENALRAQRIVWVAGSHLPGRVTVAPGVKHVFLARGVLRQQRAPRKG